MKNPAVASAADVHPGTVSKWRHDVFPPAEPQLVLVAQYLDVTPRWLRYGDETDSPLRRLFTSEEVALLATPDGIGTEAKMGILDAVAARYVEAESDLVEADIVIADLRSQLKTSLAERMELREMYDTLRTEHEKTVRLLSCVSWA